MMATNLYRFLIFLSLFIILTSCAQRSPQVQDSLSLSPLAAEPILEAAMSENLGRVTVDIPVSDNVQVYADYDKDKVITVFFTPAITDVDTSAIKSALIDKVEKFLDNGSLSSLKLYLNSDAKFLLSTEPNNISRLTLVSSKESLVHSAPKNSISSINFKQKDSSLIISIYSSLPIEVTPRQGDAFLLNLGKAQFVDSFLKKYDLAHFNLAIKSVTAINGDDGFAYLSFDGVRNSELTLLRRGDETTLAIKPANITSDVVDYSSEGNESVDPDPAFIHESARLMELNTLFPGMKDKYTGEKISIDLQNAEVELVLRLISEISGYNLVIDEAVTGRISLKLIDIPWDQALDMILAQKNLGMVLQGNLMRITTTQKLAEEQTVLQRAREAAEQALESMRKLAPLRTEYIQVNYSTAAEFEGRAKAMLSVRGAVSSDPRTNILIVTDTEESLSRIVSYVKKLDRAERQVMIEARIVYATDEFQRTLGVQWSTNYTGTGNSDGWFADNISTTGMNFINTANTISLSGTIGKFLGSDLFSLDAQLRLGESKNLVKTISAPRILTLNNNRAEIQQGTKLATATESQSGGTTTEYEEAVLKISVLPQITPDDKLILDLEISDDSPKSDGRDIDTKQTKTKMMVGDRETIVIGGVQKTTETSGVNQVPGLGDVPGLGWLFKNKYNTTNKAELLIFIQPRIL